MELTVYLAGEIHTDWREELMQACKGLPVDFLGPVTEHSASDKVGAEILGEESDPFWFDHKSAKINAIRTKTAIERADMVVVRFGEKYRQWNAAFDAGQAASLGTPYVVIHGEDHRHALKEVDAQAFAVCDEISQAAEILRYVCEQK